MGLALRRRAVQIISNDTAAQYQIARSLRFNSADSAYLSRTPGAAGNQKKATISVWAKRSKLGAIQALFSIGAGGGNQASLRFDASDKLEFMSFNTGTTQYDFRLVTTQVFRDPSAWYHIVAQLDAANTVARLFVNRVQITAFDTNTQPTNINTSLGNTAAYSIGRDYNGGNYFDGYMAAFAYCDGQAYDYTSFSDVDATTGVGQPKSVAGLSFGTVGCSVDFADNSGVTSTALGKDSSGNSNNWTPNNFSVSAGAGNDSLTDTPTNYGTDTGAGGEVRGDYCTLNPLDKHGTPVLAEGNLKCTAATGFFGVRSTWWLPDGKWYWEATVNNVTDGYIGIASLAESLSGRGAEATGSVGLHLSNGQKRIAGSESAYGTAPSAGNTLGFCFDTATGKLYIRNSSGWFNSGDPIAGTGYAQSGISVPVSPSFFPYDSGSADFNFGQRPFAYTAPSGFKALCTQNLPDPAIANPLDGFEAKLRTGTGAAANVTGLHFGPGIYIGKSRSAATDWAWYDSIRGAQKQVESNTTTAETTESTGITAFNSDGVSMGALAQINTNAATYLDLFLRLGPTYGTDAVAYTGNGSNRTIAHSLGKTPKMIVVFDLTTGGSHRLYHAAMDASPAAGVMYLDTTAAYAAGSTVWNSTGPTSSVFSVGTDVRVNTNGSSYIAFLFSEIEGFSRFDHFIGSAGADGPSVYLGFRPSLLLLKNAGTTGDWYLWDDVRETGNPRAAELLVNTTAVEGSTADVDFTSLGFKIRATAAGYNGSGNRIIYAAFAKQAGKFSRAA